MPFDCDLRPWDSEKFAQCTAKKRIIMVGDSLMRQQFQSLACLTGNISVSHYCPLEGRHMRERGLPHRVLDSALNLG